MLTATHAADGSTPDDSRTAITRGTTISRYLVVGRIGAGAMGVVYSAYDPELDRKLAVKLLKQDPHRPASRESKLRLLREAQALARLSHPNIIAVFDTGTHGEDVFIAMEFVQGETLTAWLRASQRRPATILQAYLAAGEGLAAAHAAGLIHRDFKPDNVLIGEDGRVRVADFGLARPVDAGVSTQPNPDDITMARPAADALGAGITQAGSIVGTPAYMAPEQHFGLAPDAASDQFSYCVALWEALAGERPFAGDTYAELAMAITRGDIRSTSAARPIPRRIRRVLLRGIATRPDDRWPSMSALLDVLRAREWFQHPGILAIAGLIAAATATMTAGWLLQSEQGSSCQSRAGAVHQAWNDDARAAVKAAITGTGVHYAGETWGLVEDNMNRWAERWFQSEYNACITLSRGDRLEQAGAECRVEHLRTFNSIVEALRLTNSASVENAVLSTLSLPSMALCADPRWLTSVIKPPEDAETQEQVDALRERIAYAYALTYTSQRKDGVAVAREIGEAAVRIEYLPLRAEALFLLGHKLVEAGEYKEAQQRLEDAYFLAGSGSYDNLALKAAIRLAFTRGYYLAKFEEGLSWARHAQMLMTRLHLEASPSAAWLEDTLGSVLIQKGDYDGAIEHLERAIAMRERIDGPESEPLSVPLANLGNALFRKGRYEEALAHYQHMYAIKVRHFGEDHPALQEGNINLGATAAILGEYDDALRHCQRGVRAARLLADQPGLGEAQGCMAHALYGKGLLDEAAEQYREAIEVFVRYIGDKHPNTAIARANLGEVLHADSQLDLAEAQYQQALDALEPMYGRENFIVASVSAGLGRVRVSQRRFTEARALLDPAVDVLARGEDLVELGKAELALAQALHGLAAESSRVRELAERARADLQRAGKPGGRELSAADDWLAKNLAN